MSRATPSWGRLSSSVSIVKTMDVVDVVRKGRQSAVLVYVFMQVQTHEVRASDVQELHNHIHSGSPQQRSHQNLY